MKKIFKLLSLSGFMVLAFLMLSQVALAQGTCELNGKEIPCEELGQQLGGFLGAGIGIVIALIIVGIASTIFWIMMLIHAATHEVENKAMWIIVLVFTGIIGALIYYFVVKRKFAPTTPATPIAPKQ
jgi:hypothetical protein